MLPSAAQFAAACDALGVTNADQVLGFRVEGLGSRVQDSGFRV